MENRTSPWPSSNEDSNTRITLAAGRIIRVFERHSRMAWDDGAPARLIIPQN